MKEASISYLDAPPAGVSPAAQAALAPYEPRWSSHHGSHAVLIRADGWVSAFEALKGAGFDLLVDHTAVDYPDERPRFTVVAVIMSLATQERLLVKTKVAEGESLASLAGLWPSANWAERETYDMFGIGFTGHPDLTRIYMPHDYDGWPMRKDFPLQGHLRFRD